MYTVKKTFRVLICTLLLAAMTLGLTVSGGALFSFGKKETAEPAKYERMVFFGDSVGEGWGAYLNDPNAEGRKEALEQGLIFPTESYYLPKQIGNDLGISEENRTIFAVSGLRSTEILALMTDGHVNRGDAFVNCINSWAKKELNTIENPVLNPEVSDNRAYYQNKVAQSDLIVLEIGINDVLMYAQETGGLYQLLDGKIGIDEFLKQYTAATADGYARFTTDFPKLLQATKALNDHAAIVVVGLFNPINQTTLNEDSVLPIGDIIAPLVMSMNACMKQWAEDYGCTYVDITNVELGSVYGYSALSEDSIPSTTATNEIQCLATHPSFPEGYDYIRRQVVNSLPAKKTVSTAIKVDLGSMQSVTSVSVDGRKLLPGTYSFDSKTHILTIPLAGTYSNLLAVTGMTRGILSVSTYQLSYRLGTGYTAYLLYSTPDVVGTVTKAVKTVVSLVSSLFGGK